MPPEPSKSRITPSLRSLLLAAIGAILVSGCASQMQRGSARRDCPEMEEGSASTWSLVFSSPGVTQSLAAVDPTQFREFARNDAAMGFRPDTPVLATNEWPERPRASLSNYRRIYLDPRADQLLYFEKDAGPGGSSYRSGPSTYYYNQGTWGFWR